MFSREQLKRAASLMQAGGGTRQTPLAEYASGHSIKTRVRASWRRSQQLNEEFYVET
jgi:hypothetical protein